jgi:hypothetical protein
VYFHSSHSNSLQKSYRILGIVKGFKSDFLVFRSPTLSALVLLRGGVASLTPVMRWCFNSRVPKDGQLALLVQYSRFKCSVSQSHGSPTLLYDATPPRGLRIDIHLQFSVNNTGKQTVGRSERDYSIIIGSICHLHPCGISPNRERNVGIIAQAAAMDVSN